MNRLLAVDKPPTCAGEWLMPPGEKDPISMPDPRNVIPVVDMVRQFHEFFDIPDRPTPTTDVPEADLRISLLLEETREYAEAAWAQDLRGVAHELADVVYVAYGTALAYGIDLDAVIAAVHKANMSKLGRNGQPILREDGKVLKGPNYTPPDLAGALG